MATWRDISDDPNSPEAKAYRAEKLRGCCAPLVENRIDYLAESVRGLRVLDVGVVDHTVGTRGAKGSQWLHGRIAESAGYCLGVDILEEAVESLQKAGYNVRLHDITRDTLDEKFDAVTAGEVLEHLGDPQSLFDAAARQLEVGGRLILTTPNPYYFNRLVQNLWGQYRDSVDHTLLHWPSGIAEMCDRAGLELVRYRGVKLAGVRTLKGRLFKLNLGLMRLMGVRDIVESDTLIYECAKLA